MALGKRTRRNQIGSEDSSTDTGADGIAAELQSLFQKHFEAKFKPLERVTLSTKIVQIPTPPSEESSSDWEGLSDDDDFVGGPAIVQHNVPLRAENAINRVELKAFMAWTLSHSRLAKLIFPDLPDC